MKTIVKMFFSLILSLSMLQSVSGQFYDQAIGGRFGTEVMLTYKRFFLFTPDPQLAWEVLVGFQLDERIFGKRASVIQTNGYVAQGMCYWHFDIGFDTGFSGFAGAGFFMGAYTPQGQKAIFGGGVAGSIGASYTFTHIPLDISIDWMPILGKPRTSLARGGITLRYVLPTIWH